MKRISTLLVCLLSLAVAASASAATLTYVSALNGAQESPSVTTTGVGDVTVTIDTIAMTMEIATTWSALSAGTTVAHIHCCFVPGGPSTVIPATSVPSLPGFPTGVTSGSYDMTLDLNSAATYNPDFITNSGGTVDDARTALLAGLQNHDAYFNIHTSANPTGEISGFLVQCPPNHVPEPGLAGLLGLAGAGMLLRRRRT